MFRLTIDLPPMPTASEHPSREAARAELLRFFTETGRAYRVTESAWTHTCYDVLAHAGDQALLGRAAIDAVCGCNHTHREHDDVGCTVTVFEQGPLAECECRGYEPVPADPTLFDIGSCVSIGLPRLDMSARPLSLVPPEPDPRRGKIETPLPQWDCEHQLVGALLHLSATQAAPILQLVPESAIWRSDDRWAYELIGHLVADGRDPDPVLVLATARHRPPADAAQPGRPVSGRRHHQFAVHLANLYTRTVTPAVAQQYAREVLDEAYRRAIAFHGQRMQQLAESGIARERLTDYLTAMRTHLADLWRRSEAARASKQTP